MKDKIENLLASYKVLAVHQPVYKTIIKDLKQLKEMLPSGLTYEQGLERGRQIWHKEWRRDGRKSKVKEDVVERMKLSKEEIEILMGCIESEMDWQLNEIFLKKLGEIYYKLKKHLTPADKPTIESEKFMDKMTKETKEWLDSF